MIMVSSMEMMNVQPRATEGGKFWGLLSTWNNINPVSPKAIQKHTSSAHDELRLACTFMFPACRAPSPLLPRPVNTSLLYVCVIDVLSPGIIIPLTCVVDYHGFRVLAVAKVPISTPIFTSSGKLRRTREYMVHGTPDAGGTILNENRTLHAKLQTVAEKLNLSYHTVKVRNK